LGLLVHWLEVPAQKYIRFGLVGAMIAWWYPSQMVNASATAYWNGISSRVKYPIVSSVFAGTH
jgi:hypothetical protein